MNDNSQHLLDHADFARRLALGLAGDSHRADDLVQDAWADVLASPPVDDRSPRGFIATVLRRASSRSIRADQRRSRREKIAAQPEGLPSTDEIAGRLELHRLVVLAVEDLAPSYKRVIVLRFFDGLTPSEIARRSNEPVETVRTRMKRAIAMLRDKLDTEYGSRAGWVTLVVPMAPIGSVSVSAPVLVWMTVLMSRTMLAVLVVALSLVGVWTVWSGGQSPAVDSQANRTPPPVTVPPSTVAGEDEQAESSSGDAVEKRTELASGVTMSGRVTVVDVDQSEHRATSGEIVVMAGDREHRVIVSDGRYSLQLDSPLTLRVQSMILDGRVARVENSVIAFAPTLDLRVHWYADAIVRVVDAETRRDLVGVTVLKGVLAYRDRIHPGKWKPENVLIEGAESPLAMPPSDGVESYWIHADGYAWETVKIEHTLGGERIVALEREASIVVHLDRYDPKWNLFVRLFRPETRPFGACLVEGVIVPTSRGGGIAAIGGLRAGDVRVEAHFGHWFDPPQLVGQTEATLVVGSRAEASLTLDPDGLPGPALELSGTVHLPEAYEDLKVSLQLRPTFGPPMRTGDFHPLSYEELEHDTGSGIVRWSFGNRSPGTYLVVVNPLQVVCAIELKSEPIRDVRIEIPQLADVLVTVTDAGCDEPAVLDKISWTGPSPEGIRMWPHAMVSFDAELGGFAFSAPLGEYRLSMRSDRYEEAGKSVVVAPGANTVDLQVRELPHCWIEFCVGDTIVPASWEIVPQVQRVGTASGRGRGRVREIKDGRAKVVVTEPGDYRISFQKVLGFEALKPRKVTIGYGSPERIVVPLHRSH